MMYRITEECCWPERRGLLAQIVECPKGYRKYPFNGLAQSNEVVAFIPEDAPMLVVGVHDLSPTPKRLDPPHQGHWWSCVVDRSWLVPAPDVELCGVKDGALAHLPEHTGCVLPRGHESRFHQQWTGGLLMAEWSG